MPDVDHQATFRTHARYIAALSMLCRAPYTPRRIALAPELDRDLPTLKSAVEAAPSMQPPANVQPRLQDIKDCLHNAWGTELLLALGGVIATDDEVVRLTNNWAVVQAYYTIYHAAQALLAARGRTRPSNHAKTRREFAGLWADRRLDLPPWSFGACDGGFRNAPANLNDTIHPWTACTQQTCWGLAAIALRTTRDESVTDARSRARDRKQRELRKAWQEEERRRLDQGRKPRKEPTFPRPRLTASEKQKAERGVPTKTLLDYLYRLRIKTNYEDAAMFTDGPDNKEISAVVNRDLGFLVSCSMLAHELHIRECVGKDVLLGWANDWLKRGPARSDLGLARRLTLLRP